MQLAQEEKVSKTSSILFKFCMGLAINGKRSKSLLIKLDLFTEEVCIFLEVFP